MSNPRSKLLAAAIVFLFVAGACRPVRPVVGPNGWLWDTTQVTVVDVTTEEQPAVSTPADDVTAEQPAATNHQTVKAGTPPFSTAHTVNEDGRFVTTLSGFDLNEWGGTNDPGCTRKELDEVALNEEVGSADENCVIILEWSLKTKDDTIVSGFYALHPREWFRLTWDQANGETHFVGTLHYVPFGWNGHMLAADMAGDWQVKNPGLVTYVGLSPTDPWVQQLWQTAESSAK